MFVLAHLSDPHLPLPGRPQFVELLGKRATGYFNLRVNRRGRHMADVLERVVRDLEAQTPHHVAVTGDLSNLSLSSEFAPARALLARLGPPERVSFVPGNHDAYVRAEAHTHISAWGEFSCGDAPAEPGFPFVRRRGPVALIGLSTALPTPLFSSAGRLGDEQLAKFSTLLEALGKEDLFRIVLIHHPPAGWRAWHKRLRDAAALRAIIAQHGAELMLHGHDHKPTLIRIAGPNGPVPLVGAASASAASDDPRGAGAYNLFRISGRPGAWSCELERRGLSADGSRIAVQERVVLVGGRAARAPAKAPGTARAVSAARTARRSQKAGSRPRARR
jgi:3',5'-cyclic AMP phosphodiesterase CpdA